MDYEKKYKKANEKVAIRFGSNVAKEIFQDLYESEDENIRKELIQLIHNLWKDYSTSLMSDRKDYEKYIAWLEKQGEKQDYNPYKATIESIAAMVEKYANGDLKDFYDNIKVKCKDAMEYNNTWNKKQDEQNPAWSEEDEDAIGMAIKALEDLCDVDDHTASFVGHNLPFDEAVKRLKVLKPQPRWKPNDEQMQSLYFAIITYSKKDDCKLTYDGLNSLYNDLKNLNHEKDI